MILLHFHDTFGSFPFLDMLMFALFRPSAGCSLSIIFQYGRFSIIDHEQSQIKQRSFPPGTSVVSYEYMFKLYCFKSNPRHFYMHLIICNGNPRIPVICICLAAVTGVAGKKEKFKGTCSTLKS